VTQLLSRDDFRNGVFERDNHTCVVHDCDVKAQDAHHIIERRLWSDEGYYLNNGASVCGPHHMLAEKNVITPDYLRRRINAGIIQPPEFDLNLSYDKWGEAQKVPTRVRAKYPSTHYFSVSPGVDPEDIKRAGYVNMEALIGKPLIFMEKMDGSNGSLCREKAAARNGETAKHYSFDLFKSIHAEIRYSLPEHLVFFGEWLYAKHSIPYENLESYFQLFSVYDINRREWYAWHEVEFLSEQLGFTLAPVLLKETFSEEYQLVNKVMELAEEVISGGGEGIVVRSAFSFYYGQFKDNVGKYVRENHVTTDDHWMSRQLVKNKLRDDQIVDK